MPTIFPKSSHFDKLASLPPIYRAPPKGNAVAHSPGHRPARRPVRSAAAGRLRPGNRLRRRSRRRWPGAGSSKARVPAPRRSRRCPRGPAGQRRQRSAHRRGGRRSLPARRRPAQRRTHRRGACPGASTRVILGTPALHDPAWFEERVPAGFPARSSLGIDATQRPGGHRRLAGSVRHCRRSTWPGAVPAWPLAALVYTDISRDGMLQGPNVDAMAEMAAAVAAAGHRLRRRHHAGRRAHGWRTGWPAASSAGPCTKAGSTLPAMQLRKPPV